MPLVIIDGLAIYSASFVLKKHFLGTLHIAVQTNRMRRARERAGVSVPEGAPVQRLIYSVVGSSNESYKDLCISAGRGLEVKRIILVLTIHTCNNINTLYLLQ